MSSKTSIIEGVTFERPRAGGNVRPFVATLSNGALYVVNEDDGDELATAGWYVADAAGWHDGEDVSHEPMTLADAIVRAAGL